MERSLHKFGLFSLHTLIWTLSLGLILFLFLADIKDPIFKIKPFFAPFERPSVIQRYYFQVAVTTTGLLYFAGCLAFGRFRFRRNQVLGAALLVGLTALLSSIGARSPILTIRNTTWLWCGILLLAMIVHIDPTLRESRRLLVSLLFATAIVALLGIFQYRGMHIRFGEIGYTEHLNGGRFSVKSLLGHPNYLAVLVGSVLWIGAGLVNGLPAGWRRLPAGIAVLLLGICIFVAGSRSIWLATLLVGVAGAVLATPVLQKIRFSPKTIAAVALVAVVAGLFVIPNPIMPRRYSFTKRLVSARPVMGRLYFYLAATRMIAENPVVGVGYDNYGLEFWDQADAIQTKPENQVFSYILENMGGVKPDQTHNEYLQIAAETGVIGLATFFFLMVVFFRMTIHNYRRLNRPEDRMLVAGLVGAMAVILVDALFSFPLRLPWSSLVFWLILGIGSVYVVRDQMTDVKP